MSTLRRHAILLLLTLVAAASRAPLGAAEPPLLAPLSRGETVALPQLAEEVPDPATFLGYPLGDRLTHHDAIVAYLRTLATASDRVTLAEYGSTYEGRPLTVAAISAPANVARLDVLRRGALRLADPRGLPPEARTDLVDHQPVVVWLAYGVHGNESSSAEAAMAAAYVLAAAGGELAELLDDVVVLIDPVVNPDGRERYVHGFETRRGRLVDPHETAIEHREPWPGGRQNHYLIDLNRDWSWATQSETRQRLALYRSWEPQVYVDFHEMSPDSTYFFPPSAPPIHPRIPPAVVSWLAVFGEANGAAFDRQGWAYYVGEVYDLFYPGYGDSYPGLRGAVGMTYEVAGGGRAGVVLDLDDGRRLSLADRIARHLTTSLTTVRTAATHRRELLADFVDSRSGAGGARRTYLWRRDQAEAGTLARLLELHGIDVRQLAAEADVPVRPLGGGPPAGRTFAAGSFTATSDQPLGRLLGALMEPTTEMPDTFLEAQRRRVEAHRDPDFYDITAWSLPLAFHLECWVSDGPAPGGEPVAAAGAQVLGSGEVGYLVPPQGLAGYRLAAALERRGVHLRLALEPFRTAEHAFPSGTLYLPRRDNSEGLDGTVAELAEETETTVYRVASSHSEEGPSLGAESVVGIAPARVALLSGDGIDPTSFGFLWHLLDRQVELDHRRVDVRQVGAIDLGRFDVLVLPDGSYEGTLQGAAAEAVTGWVRRGGLLVAIGGAFDWLRDQELTAVEAWKPPEEEPADLVAPPGEGRLPLERQSLLTPGAIVATELSPSHPLAAGLTSPPPALVYGSRVLEARQDPRVDVLTVRHGEPVIGGFAWPEAAERLRGALLVSTEKAGDGWVVLFAEEPDFRLFWRATAPLFLNAVMYGPSVAERF